MTTRSQIILTLLSVVAAFALGRWVAPTRVITETKTVEADKSQSNSSSKTDRNRHKKIVIVETTQPDGTKTATTTITDDTSTSQVKDKNESSQSDKTTDDKKIVERDKAKVHISALAGSPVSFSVSPQPIFGGHIQKSILGPITAGVWGLSNAIGGVSIGIQF